LALALHSEATEAVLIANLPNLRTEIVLRNEEHVGIWFSFGFQFVMCQQYGFGERSPGAAHQMRIELTLFPKRREIKPAEDEY
jgi:hypothetical protein